MVGRFECAELKRDALAHEDPQPFHLFSSFFLASSVSLESFQDTAL